MLLVFRVLFSSLFFTFVFRLFFLLSNFRLDGYYKNVCIHSLYNIHERSESELDNLFILYVFDTPIQVRHHLLTVIYRK